MLSVCMITYNHEKFIEQAIQSAIDQVTNFDFELVIAEDRSTDRTREICFRLKEQYPNKIKLITRDHNVGAHNNFIECFNSCKGKYISLLEGDDYWTDVNKLQQQVDFLENNSDYAICFHNCLEKFDDKSKEDFLYCPSDLPDTLIQRDLIDKMNFIPTCSVVFRNKLFKEFPLWYKSLGMGDWTLHILNSNFGKIKFFNKVMSVHRLHDGGVWTGSKQIRNEKLIINALGVLKKEYPKLKNDIAEKIAMFAEPILWKHYNDKDFRESFKYFLLYFSNTKSSPQQYLFLLKLALRSYSLGNKNLKEQPL